MAQLKTNGTMTDEEKENFQEFLTTRKGQQILDKELPGQSGMVVVQA